PNPDWRPRPKPPTYPLPAPPPIFDPIGTKMKMDEEYEKNERDNINMNSTHNRNLSNYYKEVREAKASDPLHWREKWIQKYGMEPIEPPVRQRVDL
ncbi:MAG: hypothetical protein WBO24_05360, partial [Nitrospirales bacterium]